MGWQTLTKVLWSVAVARSFIFSALVTWRHRRLDSWSPCLSMGLTRFLNISSFCVSMTAVDGAPWKPVTSKLYWFLCLQVQDVHRYIFHQAYLVGRNLYLSVPRSRYLWEHRTLRVLHLSTNTMQLSSIKWLKKQCKINDITATSPTATSPTATSPM